MAAPQKSRGPGKFASDRDELLHVLATGGYANESSGDVSSSAGWFCRISNYPEDMAEIGCAFDEDVARLGRAALDAIEGHWILVESDQGFVDVTEHPTEPAAMAAYLVREEVYLAEQEAV